MRPRKGLIHPGRGVYNTKLPPTGLQSSEGRDQEASERTFPVMTNVISHPALTRGRSAAENRFAADYSDVVKKAQERFAEQDKAVLLAALSDAEMTAERELTERLRHQERHERQAAGDHSAKQAARQREFSAQTADIQQERQINALRAQLDFDQATNPLAMTSKLYRLGIWVPRALVGVMIAGTLISGINVQRNFFPTADFADPLYYLTFLFEALISVPLIVVMVTATTAAQRGATVNRRKIFAIEAALLLLSIALNVAPHIGHGWRELFEYGFAPVLVAASVWMHPWVSTVFAGLVGAELTTVRSNTAVTDIQTAA